MGKPALVRAITRLNNASEQTILAKLPHIRLQSAGKQEIKDKQLQSYCEDPALSLSTPGVVFKALEVPKDTPVISDADRANLLDVLCCSYDFTKNQPKGTGDLKDAWDAAKMKQGATSGVWWAACGELEEEEEEEVDV